jgi:hypothetical protein
MKHNKFRNVGLTYDILIGEMSRRIVEGDNQGAGKVLDIIKRHYGKDSIIQKEFRLIDALANENVSSEAIATRALSEACSRTRGVSKGKLTKEIDSLIFSMKKLFGDKEYLKLYEQQFEPARYRAYASAYMLVREWSGDTRLPLADRMRLEQTIVDRMISPIVKKDEELLPVNENAPAPRVLIKLMVDKVNERYGKRLVPAQRSFVRSWALSANDRSTMMERIGDEIRMTLGAIDEAIKSDPDVTDLVRESLVKARGIIEESKKDTDINKLAMRCLMYIKLREELQKKEESNVSEND